MLIPVPSVVCVLVIETLWISMLNPVKSHHTLFGWTEKIRFLKTIFQPVIIFTPEKMLWWNMTKEDEC
jgi:hypothetical protein